MGSGGCCYWCGKGLIDIISQSPDNKDLIFINKNCLDEMLLCRECYQKMEEQSKELLRLFQSRGLKIDSNMLQKDAENEETHN